MLALIEHQENRGTVVDLGVRMKETFLLLGVNLNSESTVEMAGSPVQVLLCCLTWDPL